jgi:hypothetical protein
MAQILLKDAPERGFMKMIKSFLLAGICGALPISIRAVPLDITLTGTAPVNDTISGASEPASINIDGVTSIQVTWNAPAGYMYVVNPPPADDGNAFLAFESDYGLIPQTVSLGSVTASSVSVNTVFGTSPLGGGVALNNDLNLEGEANYASLITGATATITPTTAPFGFTSITITGDFSGTGADVTLGRSDFSNSGPFGVLLFEGPEVTDPGSLLTLEPLGGSVPDAPSTVFLAGMSFAGFWLCGRKLTAGNS